MRTLVVLLLLFAGGQLLAGDGLYLVTVRINDDLSDRVRERRYEDPLDRALKRGGVGEVRGSSVATDMDTNDVLWVNIHARLSEPAEGLRVLLETMSDAEDDTFISCRFDGERIEFTLGDPSGADNALASLSTR